MAGSRGGVGAQGHDGAWTGAEVVLNVRGIRGAGDAGAHGGARVSVGPTGRSVPEVDAGGGSRSPSATPRVRRRRTGSDYQEGGLEKRRDGRYTSSRVPPAEGALGGGGQRPTT